MLRVKQRIIELENKAKKDRKLRKKAKGKQEDDMVNYNIDNLYKT